MKSTIKEMGGNSKAHAGIAFWGPRGLKNGSKSGFLRVSEEVYIVVIITLVALLSFGLGRLSAKPASTKTPVRLVQTPGVGSVEGQGNQKTATLESPQAATASVSDAGEAVVASKQGTKYHYSWCPGASKIAPANKITFQSEAAAIAAGYTKASNCK